MGFTMKEPQAQPDTYNGIEFRSKLESKTAQALDNIGIAYIYEPNGYKLSNGMWYKPDFWLPNAHQFIECKGIMQSTDSAKIMGLVEDTNRSVIVISYDKAMMFKRFWGNPQGDIVTYSDYISLGTCAVCGKKFFYAEEDTFACPACGAYDGDHYLGTVESIESGQKLFDFGQKCAADNPIFQKIADEFNN